MACRVIRRMANAILLGVVSVSIYVLISYSLVQQVDYDDDLGV